MKTTTGKPAFFSLRAATWLARKGFRLLLLGVVLLSKQLAAVAQPTGPRWAQAWTIPSTPQTSAYDRVRDVAVDGFGNVYAVGQFAGTADFGNGITATSLSESNGFIAKYDPAGVCQWVVTANDTIGGDQDFGGVTCDPAGNVYALGSFTSYCQLSNGLRADVPPGRGGSLLVRLDPQGQGRWLRQIAVAPATAVPTIIHGSYLRADERGHLVVAGNIVGEAKADTLTLTAGTWALWVAQFDTSGAGLWGRVYGEAVASPEVTGLAVTSEGESYLVGDYLGRGPMTFGNGVALSNGTLGSNFLARLDAAGRWRWVQGCPGIWPRAMAVATNRRGQVFISTAGPGGVTFGAITTPTSTGWRAAQWAAYDTTGQVQWAVQAAGPGPGDGVSATALATDAAGDLYGASFFRGTITFPGLPVRTGTGFGDAYAAKFSAATGQLQWLLTDDGQGGSVLFPYALADAGPAGLIIGGEMNGQVQFGTTTLQVTSSTDPCLARVEEILLGVADEQERTGVRVWPNPARGQLQLTCPAAAAQAVTLTDVLGRPVRHWALAAQQVGATLDVTGLPAGVYVLRLGHGARRVVLE